MWRKARGLCQNLWILVAGSSSTGVTLAQSVLLLASLSYLQTRSGGLGDSQLLTALS